MDGSSGRKTGCHLRTTVLKRFIRQDCFLGDGAKVMSEKGSFSMQTLPCFMRNFNTYVRIYVPQDEKLFMALDGHSSRKEICWLEEATKNSI